MLYTITSKNKYLNQLLRIERTEHVVLIFFNYFQSAIVNTKFQNKEYIVLNHLKASYHLRKSPERKNAEYLSTTLSRSSSAANHQTNIGGWCTKKLTGDEIWGLSWTERWGGPTHIVQALSIILFPFHLYFIAIVIYMYIHVNVCLLTTCTINSISMSLFVF